MRALLVVLSAACGCGAQAAVQVTMIEHDWRDLEGTSLQLRVKTDVAIASDDRMLVRGPLQIGSTPEAPLEDRRCTVTVLSTGTYSDTDYRGDTKPSAITEDQAADDTRSESADYRNSQLVFRCSDGAAPGTPAAMKGGKLQRAPRVRVDPAGHRVWIRLARPR